MYARRICTLPAHHSIRNILNIRNIRNILSMLHIHSKHNILNTHLYSTSTSTNNTPPTPGPTAPGGMMNMSLSLNMTMRMLYLHKDRDRDREGRRSLWAVDGLFCSPSSSLSLSLMMENLGRGSAVHVIACSPVTPLPPLRSVLARVLFSRVTYCATMRPVLPHCCFFPVSIHPHLVRLRFLSRPRLFDVVYIFALLSRIHNVFCTMLIRRLQSVLMSTSFLRPLRLMLSRARFMYIYSHCSRPSSLPSPTGFLSVCLSIAVHC
ncbi:hypothetical protein C8Q74DRAFT_978112 [Fomes fomentarius]|nr:hypothetical protein C8Q74DRAFT_978112 [Fomes fomentarius]